LLLPLTAIDYLLWDWSVAGSHDVLALISGMTLLPLAVLSLWLAGIGALRLIARSLRRSSKMVRSVHPVSSRSARRRPRPAQAPTASPAAQQRSASERKLAA
jgi:predicted short-subunit dehydrogenase-like oxidoreductase (DUF2520 family)